jgi:hypothetical protein
VRDALAIRSFTSGPWINADCPWSAVQGEVDTLVVSGGLTCGPPLTTPPSSIGCGGHRSAPTGRCRSAQRRSSPWKRGFRWQERDHALVLRREAAWMKTTDLMGDGLTTLSSNFAVAGH